MENNIKGLFLVKLTATLLLLFVGLYSIVGVISAVHNIKGLGPAFDSNNSMVMLLAYGTVYIALVSALAGLEICNDVLPPKWCRTLGLLIIVTSLIAILYIRIKEHQLEIFNIASAFCGVMYLSAFKYFEKKSVVS